MTKTQSSCGLTSIGSVMYVVSPGFNGFPDIDGLVPLLSIGIIKACLGVVNNAACGPETRNVTNLNLRKGICSLD